MITATAINQHIAQPQPLAAKVINGICIDDFSADRFALKINWRARNKREPQVTEICRPYYDLWLQYTGRLDWCLQGRGDAPQYIAGTMAADDYWENAEYDVKLRDIVSYILKEVMAQKVLS